MPDLSKAEKVAAVGGLIAYFKKVAEVGRKPGIGGYAERRLPALEAALERHKAS